MEVVVKFKSLMNVVWGTNVNGKEAFAFLRGFPATFILTQRRAIVLAEFSEKMGWFQKKAYHRLVFEAGLHEVSDFKITIKPTKKIRSGFISFRPHGQLGENATVQFLNMDRKIGDAIEKHLTNLVVKNPVKNSGIVIVNDRDVHPTIWWNRKYGDKKGKLGDNLRDLQIDSDGKSGLFHRSKK